MPSQERNFVKESAYQIELSVNLYHKLDGKPAYLTHRTGTAIIVLKKEDIPAVRGWLKQETARAKSIFWSAKGARKFLKGEGNG